MLDPKDHRRLQRRVCMLEASLSGNEKHPFALPVLVEVVNIATIGVGLRCNSAFEVGTVLAVNLLPNDPDSLPACQVRVVHSTDQEDGTWIVGAEFLEPLTEDDFKTLLLRPG